MQMLCNVKTTMLIFKVHKEAMNKFGSSDKQKINKFDFLNYSNYIKGKKKENCKGAYSGTYFSKEKNRICTNQTGTLPTSQANSLTNFSIRSIGLLVQFSNKQQQYLD